MILHLKSDHTFLGQACTVILALQNVSLIRMLQLNLSDNSVEYII